MKTLNWMVVTSVVVGVMSNSSLYAAGEEAPAVQSPKANVTESQTPAPKTVIEASTPSKAMVEAAKAVLKAAGQSDAKKAGLNTGAPQLKKKTVAKKPLTPKSDLTKAAKPKAKSVAAKKAAPVVAVPVVITQAAPMAVAPVAPTPSVVTQIVEVRPAPVDYRTHHVSVGLGFGGNIANTAVKGEGQSQAISSTGASNSFSLAVDLPIHEKWSVSLGLGSVGRNIQFASASRNFFSNWAKFSPVMNFWVSPYFAIGAGGYVGARYGDTVQEDNEGIKTSSQQYNSIFRPDYGLVLSTQARTKINHSTIVFAESRYNHGLANVVKPGEFNTLPGVSTVGGNIDSTRVRELQLMVGVGFEFI